MIFMFVVFGYCLLCDIVLLFDRIILIMGVNGSGKLSFYRLICLLVDVF